jgi:hypothetical protein
MSSQTLMVRSASSRVSNHEPAETALIVQRRRCRLPGGHRGRFQKDHACQDMERQKCSGDDRDELTDDFRGNDRSFTGIFIVSNRCI